MSNDKMVKLSPPWVTLYHEVEALFGEDPQIKTRFDAENYIIYLYVDGNEAKYEALTKILPSERSFGNVKVKIEIVPSNSLKDAEENPYKVAFQGNPVLADFVEVDVVPFGHFRYAVFKNKVVQFFNDQLEDINGNRSTLYQDIARDLIGEQSDVFFCTEAGDSKLEKPLGEWP